MQIEYTNTEKEREDNDTEWSARWIQPRKPQSPFSSLSLSEKIYRTQKREKKKEAVSNLCLLLPLRRANNDRPLIKALFGSLFLSNLNAKQIYNLVSYSAPLLTVARICSSSAPSVQICRYQI